MICMDFWWLNVTTKKISFPLPFTKKVLDQGFSHEVYSFLYGFSSYPWIMITSKDKYKIAFMTNWGVFVCVATLLWPSVGVKPNTWKKWGVGVLRDSRMFRARQQGAKHLALGFLVSLERSWNVNIWNALAFSIWTSVTQVIGKRRVGSQTGSLTPDH
jgi:hypothetical protein